MSTSPRGGVHQVLFFSFKPTSPAALAPLSPPDEWGTPGISELCAVLPTQRVEETVHRQLARRPRRRSEPTRAPATTRAGEAEAEEVKHISCS